ncbi:piRNA biogenesis protein EXD1 [Frankliniella fusca]|uniref:PiRNA biogenesis protein EXD1 n=1 Tax=Frankliniella fusca TaxID=407009 RepID=A0AAE1HZ81_9NEOP|nr:piRNA biogenesis protein EXD1 [Frankliniella fusca]
MGEENNSSAATLMIKEDSPIYGSVEVTKNAVSRTSVTAKRDIISCTMGEEKRFSATRCMAKEDSPIHGVVQVTKTVKEKFSAIILEGGVFGFPNLLTVVYSRFWVACGSQRLSRSCKASTPVESHNLERVSSSTSSLCDLPGLSVSSFDHNDDLSSEVDPNCIVYSTVHDSNEDEEVTENIVDILQQKVTAFLLHIKDECNASQTIIKEVIKGVDDVIEHYLEWVKVLREKWSSYLRVNISYDFLGLTWAGAMNGTVKHIYARLLETNQNDETHEIKLHLDHGWCT